jgi:hypothetical protein
MLCRSLGPMLALRGRCSRGCAAYGRRLFPFTACAPFLPCERSEAAACRCSKDFPFPLNGHIASCNGGGDCLLIGGNFVLTGKPADILLAELPPIVHIQKESEKAAIRWSRGVERSATRRFSGRATARLSAAGSGAASSSGRRVERLRGMVLRSIG